MRGEENGRAKMTADKVREARRMAAEGQSHSQIAKAFGMSRKWISRIVQRKNWSHVE